VAPHSFLKALLAAAIMVGPTAFTAAANAQPAAMQQPTTRTAFERFRYAFFEDPDSARDFLDTRTLTELAGADRAKAERMLIDFLPDARAVIGLGLLRSHKAEPKLTQLFRAASRRQRAAAHDRERVADPLALIYLSKALWQVDPDPRWPAALIKVLTTGEAIERQDAAMALGIVHERTAARALTKALDDTEPLVRHHAAKSLLAIYGLPAPDLADTQNMVYRVMSEDAERRAGGKQDILAAIAGRKISAC
jgi:hypothetical protein